MGLRTFLGSASILDRVLKCPASNQLEQQDTLSEAALEAAEWGTAVHRVLELAPETPSELDNALRQIPKRWVSKAKHIPVSKTVAPRSRPGDRELSLAWRGRTGTVDILGNGLGRDYGKLDDHDVTGTADVVLLGYKTLEVFDYKTGKYVPDAERSAQLKHLAMMAAKNAPAVEVVVAGFQRIREDKRRKQITFTVRDEWAVFSRLDLDLHELRLRKALAKAEAVRIALAEGKDPEVNPGEWCRFCPAKAACPSDEGRLWGVRRRAA